jgi:succinyl-CoA synthetase alpha subunit
MIVRGSKRVLVQGITGRQASFWTERMQAYGTRVIGGVNPKKAGTTHCNVPVYGSAREAMEAQRFEVSVIIVPPLAVCAAALDAIKAGAQKLVVLTEHTPVQDVMVLLAAARDNSARVLGPNTAGLVTPGECFVGFMPAFNERIFRPGRIGVISRSGSLGTLACLYLLRAGLGQSAFLVELDRDERTEGVLVVGEIGGSMEEDAAEYAADMKKPVVAFIAGGASPPGKRMGHAGAIVMGTSGSYASKRTALERAGVNVLDTPSDVGTAMAEALK